MKLTGLIRAAFFLLAMASASQETAAQAPEPVKVGKLHPPLALWTIEHDKPVSLESLRGKKVILIHFASWSGPSRQQIEGWFEHLRTFVNAKKVVVLGVDHEQHADRARLFAQWKGLKEPILHDPLDLSAVTKLPFVVAIDEEGIVRSAQPSIDKIDKGFIHRSAPRKKEHSEVPEAALPDPRVMRRTASEARKASVYRELGDALVLGGAPIQINEAIKTYKQVLQLDPKDAWSCFRMGAAYRIRYEREDRQPGDFQFAIDAWEDAVKLEPGCEIYRQRLRQYGPAVPDSEASYD
jgi:peroxiredoxin